jgi:hypothetical protein
MVFDLPTARAQSCVPFVGSPRTGNKCDSLVSYPTVLLAPNQTYAQVRLPPPHLQPPSARNIPHSRSLASAPP